MSVVIETTLGDITVDLFITDRPRVCQNFLKLCKLKYYNYNLFHTISRGFIAQTGDPTGSRSGGESIFSALGDKEKRYFKPDQMPRIKHSRTGLISFVGDSDEGLVGSQFFITLGSELFYLDESHCVFGEVVEGHDVLEIFNNEVICDGDHRPYKDVRVTHTVVLDDPFPPIPKFPREVRSPSPSAERLKGGRIAADEDVDDMAGKTANEVNEMVAEREAKARATILEMVGDLPDAEMAPPENVLFVCKLNPVTTDDDLEIIFSRFGKIKGCEVIRDKKTGDSLQYAFVEFEDQHSCEDAYFKMDNVLIDDRRIHVDFSQSVAKVRWFGKGKGIRGGGKDLGQGKYQKDNNTSAQTTRRVDKQDRNQKVSKSKNHKDDGNDDDVRRRHRSKERSTKPSEKDRRRDREGNLSDRGARKDRRRDRDSSSDRDARKRDRSRDRDDYKKESRKDDRHNEKSRSRRGDKEDSRRDRSDRNRDDDRARRSERKKEKSRRYSDDFSDDDHRRKKSSSNRRH